MDLNTAPIWFGGADLPEWVDAAKVSAEANAALRNGVKPPAADRVQAALRRGGKTAHLANREALERKLAAVLQEFSPNETDLIRTLRLSSR